MSDLRVFVASEQWRSSDQPDIVVPHHGVDLVVIRHSEFVLEHCEG